MNPKQARSAIEILLDKDIPAHLWGPPGVGKSDTVRQIGESRGWSTIDFRCSTRDPVALMGLPDIAGDTARWKVPDEFPQVERDGEEGILFLDEINVAAPSMQAAAFGLVLDRKVGEYVLPAGWRIVAAGNRQADRAAAQRMPSALANRFAHIDVDADIDSFVEWANAKDMSPIIVAFLRWRPNLLHHMQGEARAFPTPRAWASVDRIVDIEGPLRLALVTAIVGEGAAAELEGFIRTYRSLPSLDHVLANPNSAKLPEDPSARFAIATGLARKVTDQTFENGMTYIRRLPREFEIVFTLDAVKRDAGLSHTGTFVDWANRNQDVTIG